MDGQRAGQGILIAVLVVVGLVTAHLAVDRFGAPVRQTLTEGVQSLGGSSTALTLEARYTFESSIPTTVYDRSSTSRNLELRGPQRVNVTYPGTNGTDGTGLDFAAGDSAYVAPSGMISEDVTVSFWFRPGNWSGDEWEGNLMWQLAEDSVNFRIVGGKPGSSLVFQRIGANDTAVNMYSQYRDWDMDEWYHIMVQQYDDQWELYIDGELDRQKESDIEVAMSSTGFELGSSEGRFDGVLDDVRIYSGVPLTPEQVGTVMERDLIT